MLSNNKLNFLDILVEKCQNGFNTSIFRKTTHTGLGMKFHSFIPYLFKTNLISCLIKRAFHLCSTEILFINEFKYLRSYFLQNNFRIKLIKITAATTLNSIYNPRTSCQSVQKKRIYIELPFLGSHGHIYERKLKQLVSKFYPQLNLTVIHRVQNTIQNFLKFKAINNGSGY